MECSSFFVPRPRILYLVQSGNFQLVTHVYYLERCRKSVENDISVHSAPYHYLVYSHPESNWGLSLRRTLFYPLNYGNDTIRMQRYYNFGTYPKNCSLFVWFSFFCSLSTFFTTTFLPRSMYKDFLKGSYPHI